MFNLKALSVQKYTMKCRLLQWALHVISLKKKNRNESAQLCEFFNRSFLPRCPFKKVSYTLLNLRPIFVLPTIVYA